MRRKVFLVIASFVVTFGVHINLSSTTYTESIVKITASVKINLPSVTLTETPAANLFLYVVLFGVFLNIFKRTLKVNDKNIMLYAFIAAFFISAIEIIGRSLDLYNYLLLLYSSPKQILLNCVEFTGLLILLYCCLVLLFEFLTKHSFADKVQKTFFSALSIKNKTFIIWLVIFLSWLPYLLIYYPGVLTPDSIGQIKQALDISAMTNHHPVFHTFIIKICMKLGSTFGSNMAGVTIYSILQMILMSGIFAFTIYYMDKNNIHRYLRRVSFIFFAFFPVNAIYSITMWKDILFGGMMLLFTICVIEMLMNPEKAFGDRRCLVLFFIVTILVILLRNNGFYVILLSFPFIIYIIKNKRKTLMLFLVLIIAFNAIYTGPLFNALGIEKGSPREALSVPLQQMARVAKYRDGKLNKDELAIIDSIFSSVNIAECYNPRVSDPVKNKFNLEYYNENKMLFYTTWIKMSFRFPKEFVESYLANSFGYWYPETMYVMAQYDVYKNELGIAWESVFPRKVGDSLFNIVNLFHKRDIPVLSMLYSIGFGTILLLLSICLVLIKKQRRFIMAFVTVLVLLLTCTASPVYGLYRYIYGMFTCLPLLVSFALYIQRNDTCQPIVEYKKSNTLSTAEKKAIL